MRWPTIAFGAVAIAALVFASHDFYIERRLLTERNRLADDALAAAKSGQDNEAIESAADFFLLKPRHPSAEREQFVLGLYHASLWRWLLRDARATPERAEAEIARYEATEKTVKAGQHE